MKRKVTKAEVRAEIERARENAEHVRALVLKHRAEREQREAGSAR